MQNSNQHISEPVHVKKIVLHRNLLQQNLGLSVDRKCRFWCKATRKLQILMSSLRLVFAVRKDDIKICTRICGTMVNTSHMMCPFRGVVTRRSQVQQPRRISEPQHAKQLKTYRRIGSRYRNCERLRWNKENDTSSKAPKIEDTPSFFIEFGPKIKQNNQPGLQSIARIVACAGTLIIVHIVFRSSTQNEVLVQGRRIREKRGPADDGQAQISGQRFRRKAKNFTWTQN